MSRALGGAAALLACLAAAAAAAAAPPPPGNLHTLDEGWRPEPRFRIAWTNPASSPPVAAVHYLVRDPLGSVEAGPVRVDWAEDRESIAVGAPGAHTIEVWLEDSAGAQGAPASTLLRYDPTRPADVQPLSRAGWIGRAQIPFAVRIAQPAGPPPPAGIRGYAVSVDRLSEASPCADAEICTDAETDLRGGAEDDALVVDELPEGTLHVHALAVSGSGMRSAVVGSTVLRVDKLDPVTELLGAPAGWSRRPVALEARATDSGSGMDPSAGGGPYTALRVDGAAPTLAPGASARTTVIGEGLHTVAYYARDAAGNVDDGARGDRPPRSAIVRIDRTPPAVAFVGSLGPSDPELIEATVDDRLSGPDPRRGRIAVRPVGSSGAFQPLPTTGAAGTLRARWRSDEFPRGSYEFRVVGYDVAGNSATSTRRANGAPMILPNPLKAGATLVAGFGGLRRAAATVRFGKSVVLAGRLSASSDRSLDGVPVRIVERLAAGAAAPTRTTTVLTGPQGRFSTRLAAGPDREVTAVFDGTASTSRAASPALSLKVRSRVSLRASAAVARIGGRPIVFGGRVSAGRREVPPGGVEVSLQFRAADLPWSEFRTVRTDRRGRFRYSYRFSDDDSRGVRFLFRAIVKAQGDWPYEPGGSRPVALRGAA